MIVNRKFFIKLSIIIAGTSLLVFGAYVWAATITTTWNFSNTSDYTYDATLVDVSSNTASVKMNDQTDNDNSATGFGGGIATNAQWVSASSSLQLDATGKTNGIGTFVSRIINANTSTAWTTLLPLHEKPYGKPLPDNGSIETAYVSSNAVMTNNLALFHFNEASGNFSDSSGNGYTATASGTVVYSEPAIHSTGVRFSGLNNSSAIVPNFDVTAGLTTMTIEGWFKFTTVAASDVLVSQFHGAVNQRFSLQTHTTASELIFYAGSTPTSLLNGWFTTGAALTAGNWYHIALTFDAGAATETTKVKLYINGVTPGISKSGSQTVTAMSNTPGLELTIGDMKNSTQDFPGSIDELAIYSRVLTPTEIKDHYYRGALNVKYQVRTCDDAVCSGESFVGPNASTTAYYSELLNNTTGTPSYSLSGLSNNQYFQYSTQLLTTSTIYNTSITPAITSVEISPAYRYVGSASIQASTSSAIGFTSALNSFITSEGGTGSVGYQITNQGLSVSPTWYYWNGSTWAVAGSSTDQNSAGVINTNISSFYSQLGSGMFAWKAFLNTFNTDDTTTLSSVAVNYDRPALTSSDAPLNTRAGNLVIDSGQFNTSSYKTVVDWRVSDISVALLNLPLEGYINASTTALDYSTYGFNGVVTGATFSSTTGRDGKGAYTFAGAGTYITVPHNASLALTDNFTASIWVKRTANDGYDGFLSKALGNAGVFAGWALGYGSTNQRFEVFVACSGNYDVIFSDPDVTSSTDFGWHFLTMKVENGTTYFYVDGIKQKYYSTQRICDAGSAVKLGQYYSNLSSYYLNGVLDDAHIWNRVLTDEQITSLYNQQNDRIVAEEAQVGEVWSARITRNDGIEDSLAQITDSITIQARTNSTPVIVTTTPNSPNYWVRNNQTLAMDMNCTNEDGTVPLYSWSVDGITAVSTQIFGMNGALYSVGQHTVVANCTSNNGGGTDTKTFTIEVLNSTDFTIVMPSNLGQTTKYYKDIFRAQNQWVADLQSYLNTKFTSFIGDLVIDGAQTALWSTVSTTMGILDVNNVPYATTIGNHDYDDNFDGTVSVNTRNTVNLDTYLPYTRYSDEIWWGGTKDGHNVNTYQNFSSDGIDYMVINLELCPSDSTLTWANSIVGANPGKNVIVVTHAYLNYDGVYLTNQSLSCSFLFGGTYVDGVDINDGQQIWDEFVKLHSNIFMVLSGHVLGGGNAHNQHLGNNNNLVSEFFHYQYGDYMGFDEHNAITGLFTIKPASNTIQMRDYDVWFDTLVTSSEHSYTMQLGASSTPNNLSGVADSVSQISLNWGVNGHPSTTQFYVLNNTVSTTSGWTTSTSWVENSLTCGTTYSYQVRAKNAFGYIGDYSSPINVKTYPCAPTISTNPQTVNSANISIVGTSENDAVITVSGGLATATSTVSGGSFTVSVPLNQDATNTLLVTATDSQNHISTTSSVVIVEDSTAPSNPGQLVAGTISSDGLIVVFGVPATGVDFSQYKIFYKPGSSGVTESNTEINSSTDTNLGQIDYNSATSTVITGLNANIQYVTNIWAYDSLNNSVSSTAELSFYTLATVPANLVAVVNGLSVNLSWTDSGATAYYAENTTLGTNSGWVGTNAWTSGSLVCGTTYSFRVKAKNGDGTVTEYSSTVSATTASCNSNTPASSGSSFIPPLKPSIKAWENALNSTLQSNSLFAINAGAIRTNLRMIKLTFNVKDVATFAISNTADFKQASFEPYTNNKNWTLSEGDGQKTVYVRFRSIEGGTIDSKMDIQLINDGKNSVPASNNSNDVPGVTKSNYFKSNINYGSTGAVVKQLQTILYNKGYLKKSDIVGIYGKKTLAAVRKFQKDNKLSVVGNVGPQTRALLNKMLVK